jgi:hypothetical protein
MGGMLERRLSATRGEVLAGAGRYAYYIPAPPLPNLGKPGFFKKIDLAVDPPVVIRKGVEPQTDLGTTAISDNAGALFSVKCVPPKDEAAQPSRRIKVFSTADFKFQKEIVVSLKDCQRLVASRDGKYVYGLNPTEAKVAVMEVPTGREAKVIEVGAYPWMIIPLPEK